MRSEEVAGAFVLSLLGVGLAAQQSSPQQPSFRAGVDLVQIDVVAVDKDGHPVRGLTAADFTLLDRKKPQTIATFEEVSRAHTPEGTPAVISRPAVRLDVATNRVPPDDRLVVLVLDDLHIFRGRNDRAKDIARQIVDAVGPASSMAVLFTSGRHSLEFTRDRAEILAAVDTFTGASVVRRPNPGLEDFPQESRVFDDSVPRQDSRTSRPSWGTRAPSPWPKGGIGDAQGLQHFLEDMTTFKTIEDAAHMLTGAESGRKAFVLLSEGTGNDLRGMFQDRVTPCEMRGSGGPCFHQRELLHDVEAMQKANVALYIFDPRGAVPNEKIALECSPGAPGLGHGDPCVGRTITNPNDWIRYAQRGFEITAAAAGGFAVTNSDDFSGGVKRLVDEIDHYYLLGFSPTDPKGGGFRPVTVTIDRPGVTLHFRQGYEMGGAAAEPQNRDPLVGLSSGLVPKTDLPLRLTATSLTAAADQPPGKKATRVVAILEPTLPRSEIEGTDQKVTGELRYAVLAVDLVAERVVQDVTSTVTLSSDRPPSSTPGDTVAIEIPVELTLPPGRYQLRASVLSQALSRGGSVYLSIEVPDFDSTPLALGGPLVGSTDSVHVPIATGISALAALPFTLSLDREFSPTDTLRVLCPITRSTPKVPLQATLDVVDGNNHPALSVAHPITEAASAVDLTIQLKGLPAGVYRLRVTVTDGPNTAQREVGIVVK